MKKYGVYYEIGDDNKLDFVVRETFKTYEEAEKFYDETEEKLGKYLLTIDLYKIEEGSGK